MSHAKGGHLVPAAWQCPQMDGWMESSVPPHPACQAVDAVPDSSSPRPWTGGIYSLSSPNAVKMDVSSISSSSSPHARESHPCTSHPLLDSNYWEGMDGVWTGSWGHCTCVGGGKPFSIRLPADFQPVIPCSSLWLQAGVCNVSWSWHWASMAIAPQREQAASRTQVLQVKGSLSIARGKAFP